MVSAIWVLTPATASDPPGSHASSWPNHTRQQTVRLCSFQAQFTRRHPSDAPRGRCRASTGTDQKGVPAVPSDALQNESEVAAIASQYQREKFISNNALHHDNHESRHK